ncbi:WSCD family member GA21586-like isoform X2 [Penaeus chinensis]|uniref:WSCD family member GA21586-like isoform X2 n=1 Tax=Penaeus chinensis TaxID=139456 RepID=UPI001FB63DE5|nr:WSCD family member GA21586-like isoform X2 [Penaeus chinensis]
MGTLPRAPIDQCSFGVGFRVSLICVAIGAALFTYRCHRITYMRPTVSAIGSITMDDAVGFQRTHIRPIDGGNANSGSLAGTIQYRNLNINMTASSQQLWPNDTQCDRLTVRPGRGISQTWLLSFPRSGNTWTRYLVEAATGVFTTSVYHDKLLVRLGFQGEREGVDAGTTLLQKTHDTRWISNTSQPVILLIRDPQRAITSFWSWMQLSGDPDGYKASISAVRYKTPGFHLFVWAKTLEWSRMIVKAAEKYENLTTLYYEDLLKDPLKELRRILHFLRVKPDEERLACLARHLEGPFKGTKKVVDPYSIFEKKILKSAIVSASKAQEERGFAPLPDYKL